MARSLEIGAPLLVESTCNQVNQSGGYAKMLPVDFVSQVRDIAAQCSFPSSQLILGGDHLGPIPWEDLPADQAMHQARILVYDYVRAGYTKLHLDASMRCLDDDPRRPLDEGIAAQRTAELARVAEQTCKRVSPHSTALRYVIGTEVPAPGGAKTPNEEQAITTVADLSETIEVNRRAFFALSLQSAWERVVAIVVQPGVEFGDQSLIEYNRTKASGLSRFIEQVDHLIFEAHSTDYQTPQALGEMVADHFAILKVGPVLTFAFREAVFALAMIEEELFTGKAGVALSNLGMVLEHAMLENPVYWQKYYSGDSTAQFLARKYSFSDRIRYYWANQTVQAALSTLLSNLDMRPIPLSLISQYLPEQYHKVRQGELSRRPLALILDKVAAVVDGYARACGYLS